MIRFPCGIADFRAIRQQGMVYVDRTAYIREIERYGSFLIFLRPRRFGKTLLLRTLAEYYDLRGAAEPDQLFGDLAIGREPTPRRNRYFILDWDLSKVDCSGSEEKVAASLREHVRSRAKAFSEQYADHLSDTIEVDGSVAIILLSLARAISGTPHRLYLLVDEYDAFVKQWLARGIESRGALVDIARPFKHLFKVVKSLTQGGGLERIFITGTLPIDLNDFTSGFNIARNLTLDPALGALCGFLEKDLRDLLRAIAEDRGISPELIENAVATMRTWYNGYRFTPSPPGTSHTDDSLVYNPTNTLYFLEHLQRWGVPPEKLYDENLRNDQGKLAFLARTAAGAGVIEQLTEGGGEITVSRLEASFSLGDLTARLGEDRGAIASLFFYMGLLTLTGAAGRLKIPNLVVKRLFLDRLLALYLTNAGDNNAAREIAQHFFRSGDLPALLAFFEQKLLPVLSNRDRGAAPKQPGQSGSGVNEVAVKALFLSMLFDDTHYVTFSELELAKGYADLCLLVRPEMRDQGYSDLLFEFKLVRRLELGKKAKDLAKMSEAALRRLPPVAAALVEARAQALGYRKALIQRFGEAALRLRCYAVVLIGVERIVGEEIVG